MPSPKICSKPAAAFAVSLFALAASGSAAVVCNSANPPMPYVVPMTTAGVYVNLITGIFSTTPAGAPGWDFNPFGSTNLSFFWPTSPAGTFGGVAAGGNYSVLASGTPIGPASAWMTTTGGAVNWLATNTGQYFGIRFYNESTLVVNYGWIQLDTVAPQGRPATIRGYCYQNDGTAIDAGSTTPVSLQSFSVE